MALFFNDVTQLGTSRLEAGIALTIDLNGDIILLGQTDGNLGGTNLGFGTSDVFFAKYNTQGDLTQTWITQVGSAAIDQAAGLSTDAEGNIFVIGSTRGDLATTNLGGYDVFITKYNTTGNEVWTVQPAGLNTANDDKASDIAIGTDGSIYVTGTITTTGNSNVWIAKYQDAQDGETEPNQVWKGNIADTGSSSVNSIFVDAAGNVYVAGYTDGTIGGQSSAGSLDAFVAKYDTAGVQLWVTQFGTDARDEARDVVVDDTGNVYVVGYTSGDLGANNNGQWDAFIQKFDSNGEFINGTLLGSQNNDDAYAVAINSEGNILVTGRTVGVLSNVPNRDLVGGADDIWLAEYDPQLGLVTDEDEEPIIRQYGSNGVDISRAIAVGAPEVDENGATNYNIFLAGSTYNSLSSGLSNNGLSDVFLMQYTSEDQGVVIQPPVDTVIGNPRLYFSRSDIKVSPGETFIVPIRIEDASGARSIDFELNYESDLFTYTGGPDPELGPIISIGGVSNLLTDWEVTPNVINNAIITPGSLKINFFNNDLGVSDGGEPLPEGEPSLKGELIYLEFQVNPDAVILDIDPEELIFTLNNILVNEKSVYSVQTNLNIISDLLQIMEDEDGNKIQLFANGFDLELSRSINLETLNLYGTIDDLPDLEVRDSSGELVKGSLVWDETSNTLTFVKLNGILTPGEYTLFIDGDRTDGLVTPLGLNIDGDGNGQTGGDFNYNFTVEGYDKIFSIDHISRGWGQKLEFHDNPEQETTFKPLSISLNNGQDITKIEMTFTYNRDILDESSLDFTLATGLNGWSIITEEKSSIAGEKTAEVKLVLEGNSSLTFTNKSPILNIDATVRSDSPYGDTQLLDLKDIVLNDGDFTGSVGVGKGIHQVTYLGDTDKNDFTEGIDLADFFYTGADASAIAQVGVGINTGFLDYPLIAPEIIGDVTGDGKVTAFDAAIVATKVSGVFAEGYIPELPFTNDTETV